MADKSSDKQPIGISLLQAYTAIYDWFTASARRTPEPSDHYWRRSLPLIQALPRPDKATPAEMAVVLGEVIYGKFEWAFTQSDGKFMMSDYAEAYFSSRGAGVHNPTDEEVSAVRSSPIWPYVSVNQDAQA